MFMPAMALPAVSGAAGGYVAARARPAPSPTAASVASAGARRKARAAGERHTAMVGTATSGTMDAASSMIIGAVLGSVAEPLNTLPKRPCPVIHIANESSAPARRYGPGRRTRSGPSPITRAATARTQAQPVPECATWLDTLFRKWPYQGGWVGTMPETALLSDVEVRLFGKRKRTAARDQYPAQTASGVTERPIPWAAGEDAMPTVTPAASLSSSSTASGVSKDWSGWRRWVPARPSPRGQAMRPSSPYTSTDPGAPVSAEADPVNNMPMPSPKNQTPSTQKKERVSAARTVGL